jgi:hypothetical protein
MAATSRTRTLGRGGEPSSVRRRNPHIGLRGGRQSMSQCDFLSDWQARIVHFQCSAWRHGGGWPHLQREGNSMSEARLSSVHRSTFSTDGTMPRQPSVFAKAEAEPDPIFAIIKEHDAAMRGESACLLWQSVLEKNLPANQRAWRFGASSEPPEGTTDAPEWIASQMAVGEAKDRRAKAIVSLLTTRPATMGGAVELLGYVGASEYPWEKAAAPDDAMLFAFSHSENDRVRAAALAFPKALAAALRAFRA